jgi:hypothetical protein
MNNRALTNSTKIRQNSIAGKGDEKIQLELGTSCNLKAKVTTSQSLAVCHEKFSKAKETLKVKLQCSK